MERTFVSNGNKKIAIFMNIKECGRCKNCGAYQFGPSVIHHPYEMNYHKSYDWLIPVIIRFFILIKEKREYDYWIKKFNVNNIGNISLYYRTVLEAVDWYNKISKE